MTADRYFLLLLTPCIFTIQSMLIRQLRKRAHFTLHSRQFYLLTYMKGHSQRGMEAEMRERER
jgi:hypothetical protein